ncbi:MAG: hypothetical protein KKD18_02725, partial [Nanoarchaeota archaeon]|nr:hypothetical protein [Nanoarchaeota archaeon]
SYLSPPMVLGHSKDQKVLAQVGLPAAGWVTNLKIKGKKLLGDISNVPDIVADAIKRKAYRFPSIELYKNFCRGGKDYGLTLRRVALLGADVPRVKGLLGFDEAVIKYAESKEDETVWCNNVRLSDDNITKKKGDKEKMGGLATEELKEEIVKKLKDELSDTDLTSPEFAKAVTECFAEVNKKLEHTEEERQRLLSFAEEQSAKIHALEEEAKETKRKSHLNDIELFAEGLKSKGLAPAFVDDKLLKVLLIADSSVPILKFAEGASEVTLYEGLKDVFSSLVDAYAEDKLFVPLGTLTKNTEPEPPLSGVDAFGAEFDKRVMLYAEKNGVNYAEAFRKVSGSAGIYPSV